jgi:hypothetical protein
MGGYKMITNLIATVLISVVTNWVDVHEMIPFQWGGNIIPCQSIYVTNYPAQYQNLPAVYQSFQVPAPTQGKYLGKDGTVVKITEIKFMYDNKEQTHCIKESLEKIIMRCTEKPLPPTEYIWQEPIHESLTNIVETISTTNSSVWLITNTSINVFGTTKQP